MRRYVLRQIKAGQLSVTGAAFVAEVSKMTVSRWCAQAGIDPAAAEHRRWIELRERAQRLADGLGIRDEATPEAGPHTGPSKATLQRQADHANREWAKRPAAQAEASCPADTLE
ncbi:hypothetical protein [Bosea sp. BK604]|uniref:hypothetical protein n=1 Tax=Bosea sp. BK604 TaxID=2512180 RepID=UPI001048B24E|nr:hypothetical protein [Bosea sp. BK604]